MKSIWKAVACLIAITLGASSASAAPVPQDAKQREIVFQAKLACSAAYIKEVLPAYKALLIFSGIKDPTEAQTECALHKIWFDYGPGGPSDWWLRGTENFNVCCSNTSDDLVHTEWPDQQQWDTMQKTLAAVTEPAHTKWEECIKKASPPAPSNGKCELPDSDGDGSADCVEECPDDPAKTTPGICGCGVSDLDTDADGIPNCNDECGSDPTKQAPGTCGCGISDADTDNDGTADCLDSCSTDPAKTSPGACGCGTSDADADADGTPDCYDQCATDPAKETPGICGCGTADADSDHDGTVDCLDSCPDDQTKASPGVCGCGISENDTDGDGTQDCVDQCIFDSSKQTPGVCGCGTADTDSDFDGTLDCADECVNDPGKQFSGSCGCNVPDIDSDSDGTPDCRDLCPVDASFASDSSKRCSCFCKKDQDQIPNSNGNAVWVLDNIGDRDTCRMQNSELCRNAKTGAMGSFEGCDIAYVDASS